LWDKNKIKFELNDLYRIKIYFYLKKDRFNLFKFVYLYSKAIKLFIFNNSKNQFMPKIKNRAFSFFLIFKLKHKILYKVLF
jgi:hypothetical protein